MLDANRSRRQGGPVRLLRNGAVPLVALTILTGCGSDYPLGEEQRLAAEEGASELSGILTGVGSAAQNAAMLTWRSGFESLHPDARVQYLSPISVAFNLLGIQSLDLGAQTIARIFRGEITQWNDPAIAALNPDVDLPDLPITPVSRSDDSGTTENFTDYLHQVAPEAWPLEADGSWPAELPTERAQGNAGVVAVTADTEGAITYEDRQTVELAQAFGHYVVSEEGQQLSAKAVESAPLPENVAADADAAIDSISVR